jgi:hypothetical protein
MVLFTSWPIQENKFPPLEPHVVVDDKPIENMKQNAEKLSVATATAITESVRKTAGEFFECIFSQKLCFSIFSFYINKNQ